MVQAKVHENRMHKSSHPYLTGVRNPNLFSFEQIDVSE
jgi:hypothetical protein